MELFENILMSLFCVVVLMLSIDFSYKRSADEDMPHWYQTIGAILTIILVGGMFVFVEIKIWES